jgi:hypothetical protein
MSTRENMQAKVRAILERANHPNTPQAEAETALALAFRLMQKYGLDGHATPSRSAQPLSPILSRTFTITGPYRVRRANMLWEIGKTISCHSYRDMSETDLDKIIMIAFGTELDLFALDTMYRSAEMLALRLMPDGSRRFKTSWWRGYTEGIVKKLTQENRVMVKESHGAGLVLLERSERAYQAMHAFEPNLRRSVSYINNDEDAYTDGQKAGSQFSGGRSSLGSKNRRLANGA